MVTQHRLAHRTLARSALLAFGAALFCGLGACSSTPAEPTPVMGGQSAAGAPASGGTAGSAASLAGSGGTMSTVAGSGVTPMGGSEAGPGGASAVAGSSTMGGQPAAAGSPSGGTGGRAGSGSGAGSGGAGKGGASGASGVVELFNGTDLTGFNVYRQNAERAPGTLLTAAQALPIFRPENGMIHVYADAPDQSPQVHYTLVTVKSYSKYILSWDYKWGTKKFAPYTDQVRYPKDAGVLFHLHGNVTQLWPASIEFQNKLGSTGDIFALYARCRSPGAPGNPTTFAEGGTPVLVDGSNSFVQHARSANYEVADDWTPSVLEVNGDSAVYTVNGHIVNRVSNITDASGTPVTSGPIAWQAEQAEVFYRNLRIQVLP